jgi:hypothetical protein
LNTTLVTANEVCGFVIVILITGLLFDILIAPVVILPQPGTGVTVEVAVAVGVPVEVAVAVAVAVLVGV